ncbi:exodeoxyribonuclease V subunit alpha [Halochromatium salexigens]|uniref:RecBCD enzyme subunit RecD n=1 Tax=Halochromatium salexigens TaxID=49447 RepID=A0AAJ0UHT4_HALSE|nr:exodeoxyribonuclease V subunit alpha [Halochromatium salexigens]MBK5931538.1 exodeoxyribonuclease V subunit alpha [Halochromatium salexigens]
MPTTLTHTTGGLFETLRHWVEADALRALDLSLTRFIATHSGETDEAVLLGVALTSERHRHGHVCLDLQGALREPAALLGRVRDDQQLAAQVREALDARLRVLELSDWVARLARSAAVSDWLGGQCDDGASPLVLAGSEARPLLYLRRYWQDENRIRDGIRARLRQPIAVDQDSLHAQLDALFGPESKPEPEQRAEPDWQRIACARAAPRAFFIITGGPGTGKTTTVVRLLALLQGLTVADGKPPLRIELAAPTGKAAARLNESIADQVDKLSGHQAPAGSIPTRVKTLHRLLGTVPDSRRFRHHGANPLPADVVVVDEASMVDIELMARLLEALRPDARLILLGDKDQLSSVEAGAVLGDLCQGALGEHDRAGDLGQAVVMLQKSFRFNPQGGIGALARLVNSARDTPTQPRLAQAFTLFEREATRQDSNDGVIVLRRLSETSDQAFRALIIAGYGAEGSALARMREQAPTGSLDQDALNAWAKRLLEAQKQFQLLTPLRQGAWGVEGLNRRIIELLREQGLLGAGGGGPAFQPRQWFAGRPVLITRNDYGLNLMNGDIGLTLPVPADTTAATGAAGAKPVLRVAFPSAEGGVRWVLPSRLQSVETVFAMTVHKSQGSEFEHTALILPDKPNPTLTRELLYTAITRAKERFTLLYSQEDVLGEALTRRVHRASGLQGEWL